LKIQIGIQNNEQSFTNHSQKKTKHVKTFHTSEYWSSSHTDFIIWCCVSWTCGSCLL